MRFAWPRCNLRAAGLVAGIGALVCLLLRYPPGGSSFYPRCPVYTLLHIRCPGCGATRAMAALLRGNIAEAWRLNALFVLLLPLGAAYAVSRKGGRLRAERLGWEPPSPIFLASAFAVAALFMIFRNIRQFGF